MDSPNVDDMDSDNDKFLSSIYYNPKTGYVGIDKLYRTAKRIKTDLTREEVVDFIKAQEVAQIHKEVKKSQAYDKIVSSGRFQDMQMDLMIMNSINRDNSGYAYILCLIDIFTRYAYCEPIKKKNEEETSKALKKIFERIPSKEKIKRIQSDNGLEFVNKTVMGMMSDKDIEFDTVLVADHNKQGIVERFNRTLKGLIYKFMSANETTRYIDDFDKLVENYNNSPHRGLFWFSPKECMEDDKIMKEVERLRREQRQDVQPKPKEKESNIGKNIRKLIERDAFKRGYSANWSKPLYTVIDEKGKTLTIKDKQGVTSKIKVENVQFVDKVKTKPKTNEERPLSPSEANDSKKEVDIGQKIKKQTTFRQRIGKEDIGVWRADSTWERDINDDVDQALKSLNKPRALRSGKVLGV